MTRLEDFLRAEMASNAEYHCSTLPADWCVALGHPDFALEWRGISDPGLCETIPAEAGGLRPLWERGIGSGLRAVADELRAGDIGVVMAMGYEAGAIFTGERWAIRAARGLHFVARDQVAVVKAWRP